MCVQRRAVQRLHVDLSAHRSDQCSRRVFVCRHATHGYRLCRLPVAKLTFPTLLFTDSGVQIRGQHCHAVRSRSVHVDHRPFLVAPVRSAPEPRIAVWVCNVYSLLMAVSCRLAVASVRASLFVAHSYHHKPEAATTLAARDGGAR